MDRAARGGRDLHILIGPMQRVAVAVFQGSGIDRREPLALWHYPTSGADVAAMLGGAPNKNADAEPHEDAAKHHAQRDQDLLIRPTGTRTTHKMIPGAAQSRNAR